MLKINDKVEVIDDNIQGRVIRVNQNDYTIETDEGFELIFHRNELLKIEKEIDITVDYSELKQSLAQEQMASKRKPQPKIKEKKVPPMEVDLHIHQLTSNSSRMTNHEMLTLQLETAQRQLEFAMRNRIKRVVFIHGVGEGILRTELEYLFGRYRNIDYYDAEYTKYGLGATEVYIYENKK